MKVEYMCYNGCGTVMIDGKPYAGPRCDKCGWPMVRVHRPMNGHHVATDRGAPAVKETPDDVQ